MAGSLGVRLEKPGFYALGDDDQQLNYSHLIRAIRIMVVDTALFVLTLILIIFALAWVTSGFR